jgi:hypothetical protein
MGGGIFLSSGEELVAMHEQPHDSEDLLQTLLAKYPELLAGESVGSTMSQGWLLVKRELGVPDSATGGSRWSSDHLFIDDQAVPTLVEVKRSDDTRIRRESSIRCSITPLTGSWTGPAERLRTDFEARCAKDVVQAPEVTTAAASASQTGADRILDQAGRQLASAQSFSRPPLRPGEWTRSER